MKRLLSIAIILLIVGMSKGIYGEKFIANKIVNTASGFDFDIIYVNEIDVTLPESAGILPDDSFALLVNTGSEPITIEDCENATISVTSDCENASLGILINTENRSFPIYPNEAWGSIGENNKFLLDFLQEGEVLTNHYPYQTFYNSFDREDFIGVAIFNVSTDL